MRLRASAALMAAALLAALPAGGAELPPLFKLSIGGRPLAPPILDTTRARAALWTLSEDGSLYLLSEDGHLLVKRAIAGPEPWLGLDPFGRALVVSDGGQGSRLEVLTRLGNLVWSLRLGPWFGSSPGVTAGDLAGTTAVSGGGDGRALDGVDFGPDGRFLLRSGKRLLCLSPAGRPLWRFELPASSSCAPVLDAGGNFLFGMTDGRVLVLSPYGEEQGRIDIAEAGGAAGTGAGARAQAGSQGGAAVTAIAVFGQSVALGYGDGRVALRSASAPAAVVGRMGAAPSFIAIGSIGGGEAGAGDAAGAGEAAGVAGRIAVLDQVGALAVFDLGGRSLWGVDTGVASATLFPAVSRLVVTGVGKAVSYSWGGELLREASITNAVAGALLAPSGLLFSAGADWILAAYRYEAGLSRLPAPSPPANPADPSALITRGISDAGPLSEGRQLSIVADIEKRLDSTTIGGKEAGDRAILEAMAKGSLSDASAAFARRRFLLFARPRVEACRLLGKIGSPASIDALADIALSGADPALRSAALRAIGAIGVDPGGRADRAFAMATTGSPVDDEVAWALVDAIEALALRSGATPSTEAATSLMALAGAPYPAAVRVRAEAALARLARGEAAD